MQRDCATLKGVLTQLFQLLLDCNVVPQAWKESTIMPLPKKSHAKDPIVSVRMIGKLDPLQFVYRVGRAVEDATLTLMDKLGQYLDAADCCVRILFMYYCEHEYSFEAAGAVAGASNSNFMHLLWIKTSAI